MMKLTVLVDNNTYIDRYYIGEPAVSYYIEIDDKKILFDTGYSDVLISNAKKMNIDLSNVTDIILSHGHNDHTRGLKFLSKEIDMSSRTLICHPYCLLPKYDGTEYIGSPYSYSEINEKMQYKPSKEVYKISDNLLFLGEIPRSNKFESISPIGKTMIDSKLQDDYCKDDSAIVYKNNDGIFIITGCSHSGICNIVEYAKKVCNEERILGILGGFHLFHDKEQINKTIKYLDSCRVENIYPCHCVSLEAKAKMMDKLNVNEVGVGMELYLK